MHQNRILVFFVVQFLYNDRGFFALIENYVNKTNVWDSKNNYSNFESFFLKVRGYRT